MPQKPRPCRIQVKLSAEEYAHLATEAATLGMTKSAMVRDALRKTVSEAGAPVAATTELARTEALELLAVAARNGSITAAAVLSRELRIEPIERRPKAVTTVAVSDLPPGALRVVK
jgi:Ribbon-helix-helix protein, copG family